MTTTTEITIGREEPDVDLPGYEFRDGEKPFKSTDHGTSGIYEAS